MGYGCQCTSNGGNLDDNSATGVAFTGSSNGEKKFYGEFLINAGEDVVAGIRTPQNIAEEARLNANSDDVSLEKLMPNIYDDLIGLSNKLENHYLDMQDIEFTIQQRKSYGYYRQDQGKEHHTPRLKLQLTCMKRELFQRRLP